MAKQLLIIARATVTMRVPVDNDHYPSMTPREAAMWQLDNLGMNHDNLAEFITEGLAEDGADTSVVVIVEDVLEEKKEEVTPNGKV